MALGALFEILYGVIETLDAGAKVMDAADASNYRTDAPPWYVAAGEWLIVGATGAILWPRFATLAGAHPRTAAALAILWIVALGMALLTTERVVMQSITRQRRQLWRPFVRRRSRVR